MRLLQYLPRQVYHDEEHVADFQQALQGELDRLLSMREDLYVQLRPSTSTWGMAGYEREYAISADPGKPAEERLAQWRARRRGRSTTTDELIRSLAECFSGEPAGLQEHSAQYCFDLTLADTGGMPGYLDSLMSVIWDIRPAHLDIRYRVPVRTAGEIGACGYSHHRLRGRVALESPAVQGDAAGEILADSWSHQLLEGDLGLQHPQPEGDASGAVTALTAAHRLLQGRLRLQHSDPQGDARGQVAAAGLSHQLLGIAAPPPRPGQGDAAGGVEILTVTHRLLSGRVELQYPWTRGDAQARVAATAAVHQRLRQSIGLGWKEPSTPAGTAAAVGTGHQYIEHPGMRVTGEDRSTNREEEQRGD